MSGHETVERLLIVITRTNNTDEGEWSDRDWWSQAQGSSIPYEGDVDPKSAVVVIRGGLFSEFAESPDKIACKVADYIANCRRAPREYGVLFHPSGSVLNSLDHQNLFRTKLKALRAGCLACLEYTRSGGEESGLNLKHKQLAAAIGAGKFQETVAPFEAIWADIRRLNDIEQKLYFLHSCLGLACEANVDEWLDRFWERHREHTLVTDARQENLGDLMSSHMPPGVCDTYASTTVDEIVAILGAGDRDIAEKFSALRALRDALLSEDDS